MKDIAETTLLKYWRATICDGEKLEVNIPEKHYKTISYQEFFDGKLEGSTTEYLFSIFGKKNKHGNSNNKTLNLIMSPCWGKFFRKVEHYNLSNSSKKKSVAFIWFDVLINKLGVIVECKQVSPPWIPRNLLEPNESESPTIGNIDILDDFLRTNILHRQLEEIDNLDESIEKLEWEKVIKYGSQMLSETIGIKYNNHNVFEEVFSKLEAFSDYIPQTKVLVLDGQQTASYSINVIQLFNYLIRKANSKYNKLLVNYSNLEQASEKKTIHEEEYFNASKVHLGQMGKDFPLAKAQRKAVMQFFKSKPGDIFCVNGPPGTGKTTMLQSIMVSKWIESAIYKKNPPIIVAASQTNQAVTNILESFSKHAGSSILEQRWISGFKGYGIYLCSKSKIEEAEGLYEYLYKDGRTLNGSIVARESFLNLKSIKNRYLDFAEEYFNERIDIIQVQNRFHDKLLQTHRKMLKLLDCSETMRLSAKKLLNIFSSYESALINIHDLKSKIDNMGKLITNNIELQRKWEKYKSSKLFFINTFKFLGFREKLKSLISVFILENNISLQNANSLNDLNFYFINQINDNRVFLKKYRVKLENAVDLTCKYEISKEKLCLICKEVNLKCPSIKDIYDINIDEASNPIVFLDTTLRYDMFLLAMHYWEASWLIESGNREKSKIISGRKSTLEILHRYAKLGVCFITTLQSGPNFFKYSSELNDMESDYLTQEIDLLVIDEAGQIPPALGAPMMSLAKQAIVVGDVRQLAPVNKLPCSIDIANLKKHGILECASIEKLEKYGVISSKWYCNISSSLMKIAQRRSIFNSESIDVCDKENITWKGMFLDEHRRCATEIISYCNDLCYEGKLIPKTPAKGKLLFPHMGYSHVDGNCRRNLQNSLENNIEAQSVVNWIVHHHDSLCVHYKREIGQIVGIVTPFRGQKNILRQLLKSNNIKLNKFGTIHSLQGAEFPIVIFSPTYTKNFTSSPVIFDLDDTMLNVAVSRAQDNFIVFGDMGIFNPNNDSLPSGLLAQYLFANPNNEINNYPKPFKNYISKEDEIRKIDTLDKHREVLKQSIVYAQKKVIIVSPYIRKSAIIADDLISLIKNHSLNKEIIIYYDIDGNLNDKAYMEFIIVSRKLHKSGASLKPIENLHSKLIIIDNLRLVEGSFNWLSSHRVKDKYIRYETSIIYRGERVAQISNDLECTLNKHHQKSLSSSLLNYEIKSFINKKNEIHENQM
ncbi:MAG: hypothetical protein HON32_04230 [Francisellaceae bacterium]|jgi:hypothetical protein|nr:hypothetical protein [Francisellaceae bacterium]MBT6539826.1 hypothetical protein [Francisellaceae bacterium]